MVGPFLVVFSAFLIIFYNVHDMTGERRIRVVTLALPTTTNLSEVFASADQVAIATLLANKAVERSLTHKLEDAREYVYQRLVDILVAYKVGLLRCYEVVGLLS
jgi:Sec23/Sec24 helical domain